MGLTSLILPGISALGGLFGGKPKPTTTTTNSSSQSNSSNSGYSNTTPELSDLQQLLSSVAGYSALNKYNGNSSDSLIDSIKKGGLKAINSGSDIQSKMTSNILASRGLSSSPYAAGALASPESSRIAQQSQLYSQLPQLKQQFDDSNFQNLLSAFKALPTASSTQYSGNSQSNQSGSQTSTGVGPNQQVPGFLSGLGSGLAAPNAGGSNLQSILQSLGLGGNNPYAGGGPGYVNSPQGNGYYY